MEDATDVIDFQNVRYAWKMEKKYHLIHDEEGKCIGESEIKDGFFYLDINYNIYKQNPEGTIRV